MSMLRMVKLFGWDGRVKETVAEKREVELKWIFRGAMLALSNSVAKYVGHFLVAAFMISR